MSRLTKDVLIDALNRRVVAKELDVTEIRAHLAAGSSMPADDFDVVGALLFPEVSFADLTAMSDVSFEELGRLAPSEIKAIIAGCREVNPDFFGMMARLAKVA